MMKNDNEDLSKFFDGFKREIRENAIDDFVESLLEHKQTVRQIDTRFVYDAVKIEFILDKAKQFKSCVEQPKECLWIMKEIQGGSLLLPSCNRKLTSIEPREDWNFCPICGKKIIVGFSD